MKTKLLFTIAFILAAGFAFSQNLVLSHDGEALEPDAQITVQGSAADPEIVVELDVTNNGTTTLEVVCQRYELDMVTGSLSAICWGGLCYGPGTSLSPLSTTIDPGATIENDFSGHYYPYMNEGISTIAYTFFDADNPNDSVMVTVLFDGLMVGVEELSKFDRLAVYPNPANDYIKVELNTETSEEVSMQLIDVTGAVVSQLTTSANSTRINTTGLAEGIYMYRAHVNGQLIATKKIVVKH